MIDLRVILSELMDEGQNVLTLGVSMTGKVAAYNSSCASLSTPAVNIDRLVLRDSVVNIIKNVSQILRGWGREILDGSADQGYFYFLLSGVALRSVGNAWRGLAFWPKMIRCGRPISPRHASYRASDDNLCVPARLSSA